MPSSKWSWTIAIVVTLAIVVSYGIEYSRLKDSNDGVLASIAAVNTELPMIDYLAKAELHRKIQSGESDGIDALYQTLWIAYYEDTDPSKAFSLADELLALGIDLNKGSPYGGTLLHRAALMNHPKILVYLLQRCADPALTS